MYDPPSPQGGHMSKLREFIFDEILAWITGAVFIAIGILIALIFFS